MTTPSYDPFNTGLSEIEKALRQKQRWQSGISAIYAGYVAASLARNGSPNIEDFSKTEQWGMVVQTLLDLGHLRETGPLASQDTKTGVTAPEKEEKGKEREVLRDEAEEEIQEIKLKKELHDTLLSEGNPHSPNASNILEASEPPQLAEVQSAKFNQIWELTPKGNKTFNLIKSKPPGGDHDETPPTLVIPGGVYTGGDLPSTFSESLQLDGNEEPGRSRPKDLLAASRVTGTGTRNGGKSEVRSRTTKSWWDQ